MNKRTFLVVFIIAATAFVVGWALVMAQGAKGGNDGNGVATPSPTIPAGATATPNKLIPTVPPTSTVSPTPTAAPVPVATIVIRALENPYRFEPNIVTLKAGSTYALQLIGGEEQHDFIVNNADLPFYELIPANTVVSKVFTAPDRAARFAFYDSSYKKHGMVGVFIVTKE